MFGGLSIASLAIKAAQFLIGFAEKRNTDAANVEIAEVKARADTAAEENETLRALASEGTARQKAKMNWPVFWFLIAIFEGPPALLMWSIFFYNVLFWEQGIWPQPWGIAAFPGQTGEWADKAVNWLFDPVGQTTSVGTSLVAGYVTRKR